MKFALGSIVATRGADALMREQGIMPLLLLARHANGDWGDLDKEDKALNDYALKYNDGRIFSAYVLPSGDKLWIISEADRSSTCILLPSEY